MIRVADLSVRYGAATALDGVSLNVGRGEKVALIGANGAGKSTLLNALSGMVPKVSGSIHFDGRFAHVPEGRQLFPDLTVEDNLRLGAYRGGERNPAWIYELMPEVGRLRRQRAGSLSGGQQQMVAIGRGLMAQPDVIAIDEMSLGLAPIIVQQLARSLSELNATRGLTLLLVEQSARVALALCDRAYVLETGRIVKQGTSAELRDSPFVVAAYLGSAVEEAS
jgi:branched-chain amino acid transport system ATP-binding protein